MNAATRSQNRRRRLAAMIVVGSLTVAGLSVGSLAIFTDQDARASDDFYAGTIALTIDAGTSWSTSFGSDGLNEADDIKPGDTVGPIPLHVENSGDNDLRYAVESTIVGSAVLADAIQVTIRINTAGANDCSTQGATLYAGDMDAVLIGNSNVGNDTGDRGLAAGAGEYLCVTASLPFNATPGSTFDPVADNALQGETASITLTFNAEQTANN